MRFMVIVKASRQSEAGEQPSAQLLNDMMAFNQKMIDAGVMRGGDGLQDSSKGFRMRFSGAQRLIIDGPFTETKDLIAGYWLVEVESREALIELFQSCPNPTEGQDGTEIEFRPLFDAADFDNASPELIETENAMRASMDKG